MSLAQELKEIGNRDDISIRGLEADKSEQVIKPMKFINHIQVRDLEVNKKYKILKLRSFKRTSTKCVGQIGIDVIIDGGFLVLPDRYKGIIDYIKPKQPENLYITYEGRGKRNKFIIYFYDGKKQIELDAN